MQSYEIIIEFSINRNQCPVRNHNVPFRKAAFGFIGNCIRLEAVSSWHFVCSYDSATLGGFYESATYHYQFSFGSWWNIHR